MSYSLIEHLSKNIDYFSIVEINQPTETQKILSSEKKKIVKEIRDCLVDVSESYEFEGLFPELLLGQEDQVDFYDRHFNISRYQN